MAVFGFAAALRVAAWSDAQAEAPEPRSRLPHSDTQLTAARPEASRDGAQPAQLSAAKPAGSCALVRGASRAWVGFGAGMTPDDMFPAAQAATAIVRTLDVALCGLLKRGERRELTRLKPSLQAAVARAGVLEVTQILLDDAALSGATAQLRERGANARSSPSWHATLVRDLEQWRLRSLQAVAAPSRSR